MAYFDTIGNIVNDVCVELGLGEPAFSGDDFASADTSTQQLAKLATAVGRNLVRKHLFLRSRAEYTFTTVDLQTAYNLPPAFLSMVDGTGWNRSAKRPLVPVSPQQWQALQASGVTSSQPMLFRIVFADDDDPNDGLKQIEFATNPGADSTVAFDYYSRYWVHPGEAGSTREDAVTLTANIVLIDAFLFGRALKLAWKREKGFDTTNAQGDFDEALRMVAGLDGGAAPVLSINGPSSGRLLDGSNIPDNGYGE